MNAPADSTLKVCNKTRNEFLAYFQHGFLVLPDGKTVVGASWSDSKKVIMEDITSGKHTLVGTQEGPVKTVLFDGLTQTLLVGDQSGHVKQYKKEEETFSLLKDFGNVGLDMVCSSAQVGRFAIFGGDKGCLVVIDFENQKLLDGHVQTAQETIFSLQLCLTNSHRLFLSVGGDNLDFSSGKSNIFDVTCMARNDPDSLKKFPYRDLSEANQTILVQQMYIESLEQKVEKLNNYKCETENYKQKLKEAESKYQSLQAEHESVLVENERIRNRFLDVRPEFDTNMKRLVSKLCIVHELRRRYAHRLHDPPEFSFFDKRDQSKRILNLEKEIEMLNDENSYISHCLRKRRDAQTATNKKIRSLEAKSENIEKQLRSFQASIQKS